MFLSNRHVLIGSIWELNTKFSRAAAVDASTKIAFRPRSEQDILEDGDKWRKYGKKSVKNSPNPRYAKQTNSFTFLKAHLDWKSWAQGCMMDGNGIDETAYGLLFRICLVSELEVGICISSVAPEIIFFLKPSKLHNQM